MHLPKPNNWASALKSFPIGAAIAGFVAIAWLLATAKAYNLPLGAAFLVLAYSGTFLVYTIDKLPFLSPEDAFNYKKPFSVFGLLFWMVCAFVVVVVCVFLLPFSVWYYLLLPGILALMYVYPLVFGKRIKAFGVIKPFWMVFAWGFSGVILPFGIAQAPVFQGLIWVVLYRAMYIFPNIFILDYLDRVGDAANGINTPFQKWTLAQMRGVMGLFALVGYVLWLQTAFPVIDYIGLVVLTAFGSLVLPSSMYRHGMDLLVAWPILDYVF